MDMLDIHLTDLDLGEPFFYIVAGLLIVKSAHSIHNTKHHSFRIQPEAFRAPEVILGAPWGPPVDIWNLGCLVKNIAILYHPFYSIKRPCDTDVRNGHVKVAFPSYGGSQRRARSNLSHGTVLRRFPTRVNRSFFAILITILWIRWYIFSTSRSSYQLDQLRLGRFKHSVKRIPLEALVAFTLTQAEDRPTGPNISTEEIALFADFLRETTCLDADKRASASDLLGHPWLDDILRRSVSKYEDGQDGEGTKWGYINILRHSILC